MKYIQYPMVNSIEINSIKYITNDLERVIRDFNRDGIPENRLFFHIDRNADNLKYLRDIDVCIITFPGEAPNSKYRKISRDNDNGEIFIFEKVDDSIPVSNKKKVTNNDNYKNYWFTDSEGNDFYF